MGRFESYNKIGERHLIGPIGVEVGVTWRANAAPDLSEISQRVPQSIAIKFTGNPTTPGMGLDPHGTARRVFDIEHARIIRDLLTEALESTEVDDSTSAPAEVPSQGEHSEDDAADDRGDDGERQHDDDDLRRSQVPHASTVADIADEQRHVENTSTEGDR